MSKEKTVEHELIETITLEELMASDDKVDWRINGFLPTGCIAVVSGITGVKRSFWLQQMALALATGETFLDYTISEKCRVLMYEAELNKGELKERASLMLTIYPPTSDLIFNNKYSLRLDKDDGTGRLIHTMNELNIDACILDPLYMMHNSNFNDEQDAMKILNPLEVYCLERGKNIIVAAHSTKIFTDRDGRPSNRRASGGAVKGTSSQVQVAAYVWTLSDSFLDTDEGDLVFEKTRDMPRPKPLPLKFRDDTKTFLPKNTPDGKRIEYLRRKKPKDRAEANQLLKSWFLIGDSKAYQLSGEYFKQAPELVSV